MSLVTWQLAGPIRDVDHAGDDFELYEPEDSVNDGEFIVRRKSNRWSNTAFALKEGRIVVTPYVDGAFSVTHHWDPATATCFLRTQNEEGNDNEEVNVEPWQISQRALSKLFFG